MTSGDALGAADPSSSTPGTFVQIGPEAGREFVSNRLSRDRSSLEELAPELALVLAAVLLAAVEQVSEEKLRVFGVDDRQDLSIYALAMTFNGNDFGLTGDVFEWALLLALNSGDPAVTELIVDALSLMRLPVDQPQAVLVAAESGRLVAFSPELPARASLATGRRGRPPRVANLLRDATTRTWKADLLLGAEERWVSASLKSNPHVLARSLQEAAVTPHPPRIGITAGHRPSLVRDPTTNAILVQVPVNSQTMVLAKLVLDDVRQAFMRQLSVPPTPMRQDISGVGLQLHRWRDRSVAYVITVLLDYATGLPSLALSPPTATGASEPGAHGALIVVDTILPEQRWRYQPSPPIMASVIRRQYALFNPID